LLLFCIYDRLVRDGIQEKRYGNSRVDRGK
jgi:hypothetical protein